MQLPTLRWVHLRWICTSVSEIKSSYGCVPVDGSIVSTNWPFIPPQCFIIIVVMPPQAWPSHWVCPRQVWICSVSICQDPDLHKVHTFLIPRESRSRLTFSPVICKTSEKSREGVCSVLCSDLCLEVKGYETQELSLWPWRKREKCLYSEPSILFHVLLSLIFKSVEARGIPEGNCTLPVAAIHSKTEIDFWNPA